MRFSNIDTHLNEINTILVKWQFIRSLETRKRLYSKLATLIKNGVPLRNALDTLRQRREIISGKRDNTVIALTAWINLIDNGKNLATAMDGWVSKDEQLLILSGEKSGTLYQALESAVNVMLSKQSIKSALISGITYPGFLMLALFGILYLFGMQIIPIFIDIAPGVQWSGLAATVVALSDFVMHYLAYLICIIIVMIIAFSWSLPRWDGSIRIWLDKTVPYSIYRNIQGASWMIAFSALLKSGMPIKDCLQLMIPNSAPWLKNRLKKTLRHIGAGADLGMALHKSGYDFPDREVIDDIGIYAQFAGFDTTIEKIANTWMTDTVLNIKTKMGVLFILGVILVGFTLAIFVGGLFSMQNQLQTAITTSF